MQRLKRRGETVGLAESLTGGLVAARLTSVPGASDTVLGGLTAYRLEIKEKLLDIPASLLGPDAVNPATAYAMASGARRLFGARWGLGITGWAGPGGGTPENPVGTVYAAVSGPVGRSARFHAFGSREQVRSEAVGFLLGLLMECLDSADNMGLS